ncbi:MAG: hypothetical protein JXA37_08630 [Chloroflexia bacterium]|nr:hypothetical protein [Chloroflexia bacterium]
MTEEQNTSRPGPEQEMAEQEVQHIIRSARLLGVEVDETDVAQWLTALAAGASPGQDWQVDAKSGVFGHMLTLLDFDPQSLARYRQIADIVQLPDRPNVETAIALSGSAAQGRIQPYPGDYDFFERVNIIAPTREEAGRILGEIMREKALFCLQSEAYQLIEVKFGTWQQDVVKDGEAIPAGKYISWTADEVEAGQMEVRTPDGETLLIPWSYGEQDPGWCKMDWILALPDDERVVNVSNMFDVTWQNPEGELVPLDGFLDPYFQEVYLEATSIPLFAKVAGQLSPQAVEQYVGQLQHEVQKYAYGDPRNYGKVAKRLYNIFRLIGKYEEASFIRELFDEPTSRLYQVWSLLDTLDNIHDAGDALEQKSVAGQVDELIRQVIETSEGRVESDLVMALLRLRDDMTGRVDLSEEDWDRVILETRGTVVALVNEFFEAKLMAIPQVRQYIESLGQEGK